MDALILHPWLTLIPAAVLLGLGAWSRSWMSLGAGVLWLLYAAWEVWGVSETEGDPNIRIDLLLIYPVLLGITIAGLVTAVHDARHRS